MNKQLSDEVTKALQEYPAFQAFQAYCISQVESLKTNGPEVKTLSDKQAGENAKAGYLAAEKLIEIFSPVIDFKESNKPSVEDIAMRMQEVGL